MKEEKNNKRNKKKTKKKKINTNRLMLVFSFILMLVIGSCIFLNSSFFILKNVNIVGNKKLNENEILEIINPQYDKNIFSNNLKSMEKKLSKKPYVDEVKIKIKLPNKIDVYIEEKDVAAVLKKNNSYCYIAKDKSILEKKDEVKDLKNVMLVDIEYKENNEFVEFKNEETEERLFYFLELLNNKNLNKKIEQIDIKDKSNIIMITHDNTKILMPNDKNLNYNISRLNKIVVDLQSKKQKNGTIDLTYNSYALYSP